MTKTPKCFVIMPFSETSGEHGVHNETYWTGFFEDIIKPRIEKFGYICERSKAKPENIIENIIYNLKNADLVLAVLTDYNPNVWYELGVRHTLKKGTILIIKDGQYIPSDIGQYGVIKYDDVKLAGSKATFDSELKEFIERIRESGNIDNPVIRAIGTPTYSEKQEKVDTKEPGEKVEPEIKVSPDPTLFPDLTEITSLNKDYKTIESKIIHSSAGSIAFWLYVNKPNEGIRKPGNHYVFAHDTNKGEVLSEGGLRGYPNKFMFGHLETKWFFGTSEDIINNGGVSENDNLQPGWHHFLIRWKADEKRTLEFLVDGELRQKNTDYKIWPKNLAENICIGTWTNKKEWFYIDSWLFRFFAASEYLDDQWIAKELKNKPSMSPSL